MTQEDVSDFLATGIKLEVNGITDSMTNSDTEATEGVIQYPNDVKSANEEEGQGIKLMSWDVQIAAIGKYMSKKTINQKVSNLKMD